MEIGGGNFFNIFFFVISYILNLFHELVFFSYNVNKFFNIDGKFCLISKLILQLENIEIKSSAEADGKIQEECAPGKPYSIFQSN